MGESHLNFFPQFQKNWSLIGVVKYGRRWLILLAVLHFNLMNIHILHLFKLFIIILMAIFGYFMEISY